MNQFNYQQTDQIHCSEWKLNSRAGDFECFHPFNTNLECYALDNLSNHAVAFGYISKLKAAVGFYSFLNINSN